MLRQNSAHFLARLRNPVFRGYHGTPVAFLGEPMIHDGLYGPGFYLTTDRLQAEFYAETNRPAALYRHTLGDVDRAIYVCRVEFKNPIYYREVFGIQEPQPIPKLDDSEGMSKFFDPTPGRRPMGPAAARAIRDILQSEHWFVDRARTGPEKAKKLMDLGYDGIVVEFPVDRIGPQPKDKVHPTWYIAFDPSSLSCARVAYLPNPAEEGIRAYHGSQVQIRRFSPKHSAMAGIIWFSENRDAVYSGDEVGIQKPKWIMEARLFPKKTAGWDEYDRYMIGQLRGMGYDSIYLDGNWVVLDPKIIGHVVPTRVRP